MPNRKEELYRELGYLTEIELFDELTPKEKARLAEVKAQPTKIEAWEHNEDKIRPS